MILGHRCETGTGRYRNRRVDSATSGTFWQVQQDPAIRQIEFSSFAETEGTIRAEPRQCSIRESELRANRCPSAQLCPGGHCRPLKLGVLHYSMRAVAHRERLE